MARSRLLKPEFHTSPQVSACSHSARLAFIGMLNYCDDNGVHAASISRLRMEVFAQDECHDVDVRQWVLELLHAGLITLYAVGDEAYWMVTGWGRHQKIDRPSYRHPRPDGQIARLSEEDRRHLIESTADGLDELIRRIHSPNLLAESIRRNASPNPFDTKGMGREGMGGDGTKAPSQEEGMGAQAECTREAGAPKITRRRFVAAGARGE